MGVEGSQSRLAHPIEWELRYPPQAQLIGIVRKLKIDGVETGRAVTYAAKSTDRKLIGYYRTGDEPAQAIWDSILASNQVRHELALHIHGSAGRHLGSEVKPGP